MSDIVRRLAAARTDLPQRPTLLTAAVWAYIGTAVANIALTVLTDALIGVAAGRLNAQGRALPSAAILTLFVVTGVIALAYSSTLGILALRLRAGSSRARPALLTISILSLFVIVTQGPVLFVIPLLLACGIVVTRRPITLWLRAAQGLPPA